MIENRFKKVSVSKTFKNLKEVFLLGDKFVFDIGCGYGEYLSSFGTGSFGITTTKEEVDYGRENGLDIRLGNAEMTDPSLFSNLPEVIWANNLFEHLLSPHEFLINLKRISNTDTILILGVPVVPFPSFIMKLKWFRGALASNHISFFTRKTLSLSAEYSGWKVKEIRPFIFKSKIIDNIVSVFAPHQYLVAQNNKDFRYPPKKLKEWSGEKRYSGLIDIVDGK